MKVTFEFTKNYILVMQNGKQLFKVSNTDKNHKELCKLYNRG